MERNPAYQTSASLIPSSSNPSYAGLNMTANTQVYEARRFVRMRVLLRRNASAHACQSVRMPCI